MEAFIQNISVKAFLIQRYVHIKYTNNRIRSHKQCQRDNYEGENFFIIQFFIIRTRDLVHELAITQALY